MTELLHPYVATGFLTSIVTLAVGIFVYSRKPHSPVHKAFLIFSATIALWSFFTALHPIQHDPTWSLFFSRVCHIGAILIPVFFYYFTLKVTGKENKGALATGFILALLLITVNFSTRLFTEGLRTDIGLRYFTKAGPFYFLIFLFFCTYVLLGIVHLGKEARHSTGIRKKHLGYFFWYSVAGFGVGVINFGPVYGIIIPPFPYSAACGALYSSLIAYAILRHQLFDIELIIKKGLVFAVLFGVVYSLVSLFIFFVGYFLAEKPLPFLSGISIALAILLYEPLKALLTRLTNRFLFQKKATYTKLVQSLTERLSGLAEPEALAREVTHFLTQEMALEWAGLYVREEGKSELILYFAEANTRPPGPEVIEPLRGLLEARKMPLVLDPFDLEDEGLTNETKTVLRRERIEAIVPILLERNLSGVFLLGKKKSDDAFNREDEALLKVLMEEVSMFFLSRKLLKEFTRTNLELGQHMKSASLIKLARGVHHEVRNPLHVIVLSASDMADRYRNGNGGETAQEFASLDEAEQIESSCAALCEDIQRIKNSLERFALFARPDQHFEIENLSLKKELENFLALMRDGHKLDKIEVHERIPEGLSVLAGKGSLQEIFFNLFNNAFEAMEGKGRLYLAAREKGDFVEFLMRDTGPGISQEILPRIFEPYFTTKTSSESPGIGLTITKHRVEDLGGSIEARSSKGKGAEILLKLKKARGPGNVP